ncbi:hypothetical protein E2C01_071482 [Portunus trituberculatus]|uniref:Uncharacterized protein n=1 Tax=Portunus trituberculatus TaxID=210409 RepID=A0A5B7I429_PORTR|nr:hypothetical protein [Portunus trituberculatus]
MQNDKANDIQVFSVYIHFPCYSSSSSSSSSCSYCCCFSSIPSQRGINLTDRQTDVDGKAGLVPLSCLPPQGRAAHLPATNHFTLTPPHSPPLPSLPSPPPSPPQR